MRLLSLPLNISIAIWTWLWAWTYPLSLPSITEARTGSRADTSFRASLIESIQFALHLPIMARSQHYAERSAKTSTADPATPSVAIWNHISHMQRWRSEQAWRMRLREVIVWSTTASWLVTWGSIGASFIFTGDFLFEVHESPDAPGYVTNYFKVAALTFVLPFAVATVGLAVLGSTRRKIRL